MQENEGKKHLKQAIRQTKKPRLSAEPFHRQYCPRTSMTRSISIGFVRWAFIPASMHFFASSSKAVAVISQSSFSPRKKARTFVLTFEKLASIKDLPSLRMFFLRADLPLPHRNALTYPRKHRKGAHRRRHRSSCSRQQRTHTPLPSRKQRVSHPSSSLS